MPAEPGVAMPVQPRHAFTLIELLIVISVIAILIALLIPAITLARNAAGIVQCGNNQRQLGMAIVTYADTDNGKIMPNFVRDSALNTVKYWPELAREQLQDAGVDAATGARKDGIWRCPAAKQVKTALGYDKTTYAKNIWSGLVNRFVHVWEEPYGMINQARIRNPASFILTADAVNDGNAFVRDLTPWIWGLTYGRDFRHRGKVVVLFADNHVESRTEAQFPAIPTDKSDPDPYHQPYPSPYYDQFWTSAWYYAAAN
jgi:prepilin-type N-terminal cleavage/methylation domain-containing protein/prepilin-type processing-associated H-X9-DG protein